MAKNGGQRGGGEAPGLLDQGPGQPRSKGTTTAAAALPPSRARAVRRSPPGGSSSRTTPRPRGGPPDRRWPTRSRGPARSNRPARAPAHSAITNARTTGPSRAMRSLAVSDRPVIPTTVPVVSLTTPPEFTALKVLHVRRRVDHEEGEEPAPHHRRGRDQDPGALGASRARPPAPPPGPGARTVCTSRRRRRARRWRPTAVAAPRRAPRRRARRTRGLGDGTSRRCRRWRRGPRRARPRAAARRAHLPLPAARRSRTQPNARTTHARIPSTAWDRYQRWVASWAGAHNGRNTRVTGGTRPSHHSSAPTSGRKTTTKGDARAARTRGLGEHRRLGGGGEIPIGEGGGRFGDPVGVSHRGPAPQGDDPDEGAQRGEVHRHGRRYRDAATGDCCRAERGSAFGARRPRCLG